MGLAKVTILNSTVAGDLYYGIESGSWSETGRSIVEIGSTILGTSRFQIWIHGASTTTSLGYNLSSDSAYGVLTHPADQIDTNPLLGPLQDNGGPTFTHALLGCSPAIDQGKNLAASATDQRGSRRTFDDPALANAAGGDGTDIGAFEAQTPPPDTTPPAITCPANIIVTRTPGLPTGVATFAPVVRDNCDPNPTVTCTPPSGSAFPYGTTIVTCQAVDASGNSNQCSFTVTVVGLPPVARATARPAFDLLSYTNFFVVVSANNTDATVTLDGSASSDPDGDALTFAWSEFGVTFSTDPVTTVVRSLDDKDSHRMQLTVSDGGFVGSTVITVSVITASQAIELLVWAVDAAGIRRQDSQPLIVSLKSACEAFDRGSTGAGVNKLQAFQEKVTELVAPTNPTAAAELIVLAQQVIDAINAQPAP